MFHLKRVEVALDSATSGNLLHTKGATPRTLCRKADLALRFCPRKSGGSSGPDFLSYLIRTFQVWSVGPPPGSRLRSLWERQCSSSIKRAPEQQETSVEPFGQCKALQPRNVSGSRIARAAPGCAPVGERLGEIVATVMQ